MPARAARPRSVSAANAAVGGVHVQPQGAGAQVGEFAQVVHGAGVGGAGVGAHGERELSRSARSAATAFSSTSTRIRNSWSTGMMRTCSGRNPRARAARATDE